MKKSNTTNFHLPNLKNKKIRRKKRKKKHENEWRNIPAGWTAIEDTSRSPVSSFLMSFCFNKSYTRTFFFVEMKKIERVGWKIDETGRPCNLNGILWVIFLESWWISIALDSRNSQVKKSKYEFFTFSHHSST